MDKQIMAGANSQNEKFFFEPSYSDMPDSIKDEIKIICVSMAEKLESTFIMGFHEDGDVFFEIIKPEDCIDFDDIGAELEIKNLQRNKAEFLKALSLWYKIFRTKDGDKIKQQLLEKYNNGEVEK